jgi:hypothetical protein
MKTTKLLLLIIGIIGCIESQASTFSSKPVDVNKLLSNSARTDLIGREMWNWATLLISKGDAQTPDLRNQDYGISQLPNAMWAIPTMGLPGRWCYGVQTKLSDVVKVKITQLKDSKSIRLDFVPTRNEWTPAYLSTYFRALPDTLKGSYPHSGDLTIKEKKCITENNVLILEYALTHDNRTSGEYTIEILLPVFKAFESQAKYTFSTVTDARAMGKTLPVDGFVAVQNSENTNKKFTVQLKPFESKTIRFAIAFDTYSIENAKKNASEYSKNATVFSEQINKFNRWYADNVPHLQIDDYDMLKLYYYRWFVLYRNYHNPSKYIKNHPFKTPVFYESPFGSWFGSTVGLSVPLHVADAKWAKSPEMAKNDLLNWKNQGELFDNYIQYTPKSIWELYLHYPDAVFLDSMYSYVRFVSDRENNKTDNSVLPIQEGSWPTGAEYQPAFYEFTKEKWDWRQDHEGKKLFGTNTTSLIRLDKATFSIANNHACSNIARILKNKTDETYFRTVSESMIQTLKTRHWDVETGLFYSANPDNYKLALESPCYDSFMPFMWGLIKDKTYFRSFDKFFDPAWFWSDFPLASVSKTCPMYWSGNCIAGLAYSSIENPHDYDCCWNGPTWHFSNGFMCEALGSVALASDTKEFRTKWLDFFTRWNDLHYAFGDKNVPCVIEHNRPTDGARFRSYVDYYHSSWIDPFMKFYLGIQVNDKGDFTFNPFTKAEFEIRDVSIMGKLYSFSQQIENDTLIQTIYNSANKAIKTTKSKVSLKLAE